MILQKYQLYAMKEIYHCKLCNYKADTRHISCILTHLYDAHDINRGNRINGCSDLFSKYIEDYFENPLCACGCGLFVKLHKRLMQFNLFAEECQNSSRFCNPACPEFYLFKGYSIEETISKISHMQSARILSDERKYKLKLLNSGQSNPSSVSSIISRTGLDVNGAQSLLSEKNKGDKNGFKGKQHSKETLRHLAIIRSKQSKIVTKPELIMYGILTALNYNFNYQVSIDKYIVDFLINNLIIEVYGDYWHSDKFLNGSKKKKDEEKILYLKDAGYSVAIIWESQLINRKIDEIKDILNGHKINKTN